LSRADDIHIINGSYYIPAVYARTSADAILFQRYE